MSFKDHKNEQPQLRGQKTEKATEQKAVAEDELEKEALSGPQIEENHVHLQTVLMLTQLNSVYYELALAFTKAIT